MAWNMHNCIFPYLTYRVQFQKLPFGEKKLVFIKRGVPQQHFAPKQPLKKILFVFWSFAWGIVMSLGSTFRELSRNFYPWCFECSNMNAWSSLQAMLDLDSFQVTWPFFHELSMLHNSIIKCQEFKVRLCLQLLKLRSDIEFWKQGLNFLTKQFLLML